MSIRSESAQSFDAPGTHLEPRYAHHHRSCEVKVPAIEGNTAQPAIGASKNDRRLLLLGIGHDFGYLMDERIIVEEQGNVCLRCQGGIVGPLLLIP